MKKQLLYSFIFLSLLLNINCSNDDSPEYSEQIIGNWELIDIIQLKNNQYNPLQDGGSVFLFDKSDVMIDGDTYILPHGEYNYSITNENYFDPSEKEAKNTLLKIGDVKYTLEMGTNDNYQEIMTLTNYSDGKIYYRLKKK